MEGIKDQRSIKIIKVFSVWQILQTSTDIYRHLQTSTDIYRLQLSELSHALADFTHSESMTFTAAGASATVLGRPNDEIAMLLHHDIRDIRDWRCLEMSGVSQKK